MKKRMPVVLLGLACTIFISGVVIADEMLEKNAVKAAEEWLVLVDNAEYSKSWETAAESFKTQVSKQQWRQSLSAARKPFGNFVSREIMSRQHRTTLPGAPDGQYVVIQFKTSFEGKKSSVETVTPMMDRDGKWRVSGYYIK